MEETQYFWLECLGHDFYISSMTLKDGFEAWLHMCTKCISARSTAEALRKGVILAPQKNVSGGWENKYYQ